MRTINEQPLVLPAELAVIGGPADITMSSLQLPESLPQDQWYQIGVNLTVIHTGSQWWAGDFMVFGKDHYGDDVWGIATFLDRWGFETLQKIERVARKFPPARRIYPLDWSVYSEIAYYSKDLDEAEQDNALELAWENFWTIKTLREYLKEKTGKRLSEKRQIKVEFSCSEAEASELESLISDIIEETQESRVNALLTALKVYRDFVSSTEKSADVGGMVDGLVAGGGVT